jgi:hypothetical protein
VNDDSAGRLLAIVGDLLAHEARIDHGASRRIRRFDDAGTEILVAVGCRPLLGAPAAAEQSFEETAAEISRGGRARLNGLSFGGKLGRISRSRPLLDGQLLDAHDRPVAAGRIGGKGQRPRKSRADQESTGEERGENKTLHWGTLTAHHNTADGPSGNRLVMATELTRNPVGIRKAKVEISCS